MKGMSQLMIGMGLQTMAKGRPPLRKTVSDCVIGNYLAALVNMPYTNAVVNAVNIHWTVA